MAYRNYSPVVGFIVDQNGLGDFTTITAALAAASSGDTIYINSGTYTEDFTLKSGVLLTTSSTTKGGANPQVTIIGKLSYTGGGSTRVYGCLLQTNSDYILEFTGTSAGNIFLRNCVLVATDNSAINFTNSNGASTINITYCTGDLQTTGIAFFVSTSPGPIEIGYSQIANSGSSTTASTVSAGNIALRYSTLSFPITTSSTAVIQAQYTQIDTGPINTIAVTHGASVANSFISFCRIASGTASSISIGTGASLRVINSTISSTNTNAITGLGTLTYGGLVFGSSSGINVSTQNISYEGRSRTIGSDSTGVTNQLLVTNDSDTASSAANIASNVGGTSAGDPTYQAIVDSTTTWTWGIDNSDDDAWVLAQGTALGTNNVIHAETAGQLNYPLQPVFSAYVSANQTNITGDGTAYTVIFGGERFDVGANFNTTTGQFTAPVTGRYLLCCGLQAAGLDATITEGNISIVTSNETYRIARFDFGVVRISSSVCQINGAIIADMDAMDTAEIVLTITQGGGKTVDIGASTQLNYFQGYLLC